MATTNPTPKSRRIDLNEENQIKIRSVRQKNIQFGGASIIDDALPIVYTVRMAHQAGTWPVQ
jgi:hypothetical protein